MSFGYHCVGKDNIKKNESNIQQGPYGIQSPLITGLDDAHTNLKSSHPLEATLRNSEQNRLSLEMTMLKNTQGLHAPMRLAMEIKAANKIGRLPFLPSSHAMKDVILGRDEEIGPEDLFNTPEFREQMGQPHAIVEKSLGIL